MSEGIALGLVFAGAWFVAHGVAKPELVLAMLPDVALEHGREERGVWTPARAGVLVACGLELGHPRPEGEGKGRLCAARVRRRVAARLRLGAGLAPAPKWAYKVGRVRVRTVLVAMLVSLVAASAVPAVSAAYSIRNYTVRDAGARIVHRITICTDQYDFGGRRFELTSTVETIEGRDRQQHVTRQRVTPAALG